MRVGQTKPPLRLTKKLGQQLLLMRGGYEKAEGCRTSSWLGSTFADRRPPTQQLQRHSGQAAEVGGHKSQFHLPQPSLFHKADGLAHGLKIKGLVSIGCPILGGLDVKPGWYISQ